MENITHLLTLVLAFIRMPVEKLNETSANKIKIR